MLKEKTIQLLNESPKSVPQIAKDCKVSERWLFFLKAGEYDDPGVEKIERVYVYLTGKPLRLVR